MHSAPAVGGAWFRRKEVESAAAVELDLHTQCMCTNALSSWKKILSSVMCLNCYCVWHLLR